MSTPASSTTSATPRAARKSSGLWVSSLTVVLLILIWSVITYFEWVPPLYLPGPLAVLHQLYEAAVTGYMDATLWQHTTASFTRIGLALLLAVLVGLPLGLLMGLSALSRAVLDPMIEFYRPIPPLAYLPLIVIWLGIGELSKVLLIALAMFAPIVVTTASGVRGVDPLRIRMAQSLGATRGQMIRWIVIPSALPEILTGIRIGLGAGWSTLVAAELVAATQGLGFMIQSASQFLVTDLVIAGILVIAVIAYLLEISLRLLQRKLTPWRGQSY